MSTKLPILECHDEWETIILTTTPATIIFLKPNIGNPNCLSVRESAVFRNVCKLFQEIKAKKPKSKIVCIYKHIDGGYRNILEREKEIIEKTISVEKSEIIQRILDNNDISEEKFNLKIKELLKGKAYDYSKKTIMGIDREALWLCMATGSTPKLADVEEIVKTTRRELLAEKAQENLN